MHSCAIIHLPTTTQVVMQRVPFFYHTVVTDKALSSLYIISRFAPFVLPRKTTTRRGFSWMVGGVLFMCTEWALDIPCRAIVPSIGTRSRPFCLALLDQWSRTDLRTLYQALHFTSCQTTCHENDQCLYCSVSNLYECCASLGLVVSCFCPPVSNELSQWPLGLSIQKFPVL